MRDPLSADPKGITTLLLFLFIITPRMRALGLVGLFGVAHAVCPYMDGGLQRRDTNPDATEATEEFLSGYYFDDSNSYLTSDVGGPIEDQQSLKAGERGSTLLEDFIFRQKIQRFDHERVRLRSIEE